MNKYPIKILIFVLIITSVYSQGQVELNLTIINSGKYSLSSFLDPNINLWQVDIINNYAGEETADLRLEVDMKKDGITVIWGVSKPIRLSSGQAIASKTNMNFVGTDLSASGFNDNFYNEVQSSGVLPAGEYELTVRAYIFGDWNNSTSNTYDLIDKENKRVDKAYESEQTQSLLNLNIDEKIVLSNPTNMESIYTTNPWFRWESPGFGTTQNPIRVEYRVKVALFNPELHSSLEDALNDATNIYFDSGWDPNINSIERGTPEQISIQYPSSERELSCGYQYCWRVEARESINDFESSNGGIWGWPETAKSDVIYSFYYGDALSSEQISSPGSYINTVKPIFSFSNVSCADSYEIWVGNDQDPEVENPIWKSDYFQSTNYQYPSTANGLSPGSTYYWKIRVNPDTNPGPWSNIFSFNINNISFISPETIENTLYPKFNISTPLDISEYQLLISDDSDSEVNQYNILSENIAFFPYEYPVNSSIALQPGGIYFWKVQTIDDNGSYTKLITDNNQISSFSIQPIELSFPDNDSYNVSLNPLFQWTAPIGISEYVIEFSEEYDEEFNNIIFSTSTSSSFFLSSNFSANLPFQNGMTYLWRVRPILNNQEGNPSDYFSFSTMLDNSNLNTFNAESDNYGQIEFDMSLSGIEGKNINISISNGMEDADTYLIQVSDNPDMNTIIEEIYLSSNSLSHIFISDNFKWGTNYYVKIIAYSNDEIIGDSLNPQMISMPPEPGSQDQIEFNIELNYNIAPTFIINITNSIENATNYIIRLSENSDMTNLLYNELINASTQYLYEDADRILNFGETYYIQIIPLKDDQLHGISSSIKNIFIPNISPPQPTDTPFYFNQSSPKAAAYLVEISTTEDFAVIFYNEMTESSSANISNDIFAEGTPYYWRVRGIDEDGSLFGSSSSIKYFVSSGEVTNIDESEQSDVKVLLGNPANGLTISTKFPTFNWENYPDAEKYEIIVSKDLDFSDVVWNSQNIFSNSTTYPSSGSETLEYNILYYWTIRPINQNIALANFSEPFSFIISSNFIPECTTPKGIVDEIKPYFSWSKIQNATKYGLIVSNDESSTNIIYNNQNINDNIFQYPNDAPSLKYDTEYFWKIVALKDDGTPLGDYSNSVAFTTPNGIIKLEFIFGKNE